MVPGGVGHRRQYQAPGTGPGARHRARRPV